MKNNIGKSFKSKLLQGLLASVIMVSTHADDTEVFYAESEAKNNILFVMDNSGSMATEVEGTQINNGKDYVATSAVNAVEDDTEEFNVEWNGLRLDYYRYLKTQRKPGEHWRVAYDKARAWYLSVVGANPNSNDLELGLDYDAEVDQDISKNVAVRFESLDIPKDAEITSAYIQFTASNDIDKVSSDNTNFNIVIRNQYYAPVIGTGNRAINNAGYWTDESVVWSPDAWDTPNESSENQKTADLTNLVQKVVNHRYWKRGRSMGFKITGVSGKRAAQAFDFNGGEGAPILVITYAPEEGQKTRLMIMQDALKTVLEDAPDNLNIGIMKYGDSWGWRVNYPTGVSFPAKPLDALARPIIEDSITIDGVAKWNLNKLPEPDETVTVRTYLTEIADSWYARGNTPIVDSLYEASLYFRGERTASGNYPASHWYAAHPATYTRPAPDLVQAVESVYQVSLCTGTPINHKVWNSEIDRWRAGDASRTCPANPSSPTGPGSKENCALDVNELNCGQGDIYHNCVNWVDEVWDTQCTGTDESGNPIGCTNVLVSNGYCENDIYEEEGTRDQWCYYKTCRNEFVRNNVPNYNAPAVDGCQSNNIILMSDGKPEVIDRNGNDTLPLAHVAIKNYIGNEACEAEPYGFKSGQCGKELTHHLAENDINPDISGKQLIETYVIGFSSGITDEAAGYLESLVTAEDDPETAGREGYFSAQNEQELASAFKQTLEAIAEKSRSQASPGYSVNIKSGLEHEDEVYIPVFDRSSGSGWSGNLKKFKLVEDGDQRFIRGKVTRTGDSSSTGYVNAMTELGAFTDDAWDEWSKSEIPDGNNVSKGGTASLLAYPDKRNLYSNIVSSKYLTDERNHIKEDNESIESEILFDREELGLNKKGAAKYRSKLINYIRGWVDGKSTDGDDDRDDDTSSQARKHMGDMLHSAPVVITYAEGDDDGLGKKQYVFAATNEGYLHVFDTTTGEEVFAFMPKELLKNIHNQYTQKGSHIYGIDGNISYFIKNDNNNGRIDEGKGEEEGEEVWLYFGMRRGGNSYYALDVTNINKPELKWIVTGGKKGFEHLNQSWSSPYIANVKLEGKKKPVIIFTGGNDQEKMDYGSGSSYEPDSVTGDNITSSANGLYIVDADSGRKLWDIMDIDGADDKLIHGLPGGVRILDTNRNGYLDRLYFADTGGSVWRLDLDETLGGKSVLTEFARLSGSEEEARKFYNEPDIAILRGSGETMFSVSIGSGLRPHPLNEVINDHMFVLLDRRPFTPLSKDADDPILMGDLADVSVTGGGNSKLVATSFEGKKITELSDKKGWYVNFGESGEKVLASSITFEGSVVFTTLVPKVLENNELVSGCVAPSTQGRLYAMNILTGEASMNLDRSEEDRPDDNDVFSTISSSEIPGEPQRVFNKLECSDGSCEHNVDIRIGKKSSQVSTKNVGAVESVYWNTPEKIY